MNEGASIETRDQFAQSPEGLAEYWSVEMAAAKDFLKDWWQDGERVEARFLDDRTKEKAPNDTRVNLFTANVQTLRALLYGKTPRAKVGRRFADPKDDVARVAAEILERLLNTDIERDSDNFSTAAGLALDDRLLPGMGAMRLRYVAEFEELPEVPAQIDPLTGVELAPKYKPEPRKTFEDVETDHVRWRDQRWSPATTFANVRWWAFMVEMSREDLVKRFGDIGKEVPLRSKLKKPDERGGTSDVQREDPWQRAEVWEIWDKTTRKQYWWVDGFGKILDVKDDTLKLEGFWPFPRPMAANLTTAKFIPRPDFVLAQDLYDEIDSLSARITLLEQAIVVRGVYDKTHPEVQRLLSEVYENELIGIDNFDALREKGGLAGVVDWLPLEPLVAALDKLREYRQELQGLLYQVTGMSDILRGAASQGATATEQAIKAKFASVRTRFFQDEFARFVTDAQKIRAEIICKFYNPEAILKQANVEFMGADPQLVMQAIQLLKSGLSQFRIEVEPEAVALEDYAQIKQERSEFLMAVATFMQSSAPLTQQAPWAAPFLIEILQWSLAGFKGGSTIEDTMDRMALAAQKALSTPPPPPPPDPKAQTELLKQEGVKLKIGADQQKAQMDAQAQQMDIQAQAAKHRMDLQAMQEKLELDRQRMMMEFEKMKMDLAMQAKQMAMEMEREAREDALEKKEGTDE